LANMLPPFVPPSARVPSESLPLITEFVIERGAHVSAAAQAIATPPRAWTSEDQTELPSIEEFLMARAESAPVAGGNGTQPEAQQPTPEAESPHAEAEAASTEGPVESGLRPDDEPASGITPDALEREEGEPVPPAETEIILSPVSVDASEVKESTPPGARFNEEAADAQAEAPGITMSEAWAASAVSPAVAGEEAAERAEAADHSGPEHDEWGEMSSEPAKGTAPAQPADAAWVSEERDAFDWNGVGTIAAGPDETRRAEEAWSGTEWEPRRNPEHEQVATALVQLARRVRAGEVKVELPANATVEASLAAVLAALLAEEER